MTSYRARGFIDVRLAKATAGMRYGDRMTGREAHRAIRTGRWTSRQLSTLHWFINSLFPGDFFRLHAMGGLTIHELARVAGAVKSEHFNIDLNVLALHPEVPLPQATSVRECRWPSDMPPAVLSMKQGHPDRRDVEGFVIQGKAYPAHSRLTVDGITYLVDTDRLERDQAKNFHWSRTPRRQAAEKCLLPCRIRMARPPDRQAATLAGQPASGRMADRRPAR